MPNLYRVVSISPTALTAMASLSGALSKTLDVRTGERIALAVPRSTGATTVCRRSRLEDIDLEAVEAAGFSEAQVIDIIALVAENLLTNLLNNVARAEIDFPVHRAAEAA